MGFDRVVSRWCLACDLEYEATTPQTPCPRCQVRERVGADLFECECGLTVDTADSVRKLRAGTSAIERMCAECAKGSICRHDQHRLITSMRGEGFNTEFYGFDPLPPGLLPAYCRTCSIPLYWTGERWSRMTWSVLAERWALTGP